MDPERPARALVVADGDVSSVDELDYQLVIAADGGLLKARALGLRPTLVVGDGDSLAPQVLDELAGEGVGVQLHPRAKDASDTELAIREAVRRGAAEVTLIGALGGQRVDHALANVLLLASPDIDADLTIVDNDMTVRVLGRRGAERLEIAGAAGDIVSLLPLSEEVAGVTTAGLAFELDNATLQQGPTLGLSNEMSGSRATVAVERGRLAVTHTRQSEES